MKYFCGFKIKTVMKNILIIILAAICMAVSLPAMSQSETNNVQLASKYYQNGEYEKALTLYEDLYAKTEYKSYRDEKCNGEFFIDKQNGARHGDGGGKIAERSQLAWLQIFEGANPQAVGETVGQHAQIYRPRPCPPWQVENDFLVDAQGGGQQDDHRDDEHDFAAEQAAVFFGDAIAIDRVKRPADATCESHEVSFEHGHTCRELVVAIAEKRDDKPYEAEKHAGDFPSCQQFLSCEP